MKRLNALADLYIIVTSIAALASITAILIKSEIYNRPVLVDTNEYHEMWIEIPLFGIALILLLYKLPPLSLKLIRRIATREEKPKQRKFI